MGTETLMDRDKGQSTVIGGLFFSRCKLRTTRFAPHAPAVLRVIAECGVTVCCAVLHLCVKLCCYFYGCALFVVQLCGKSCKKCPF